MTAPDSGSHLQQPIRPPAPVCAEDELDGLITRFQERQRTTDVPSVKPDPLKVLRERTLKEFIPIFVELVNKYSKAGVSMEMDASNFLRGGREIKFEFGIGDYRVQLHGTVTTEAIAFHETRYSPDVRGELISGPMLRLRQLDGAAFRGFVCERLAILIKSAMRRG